MKWLRFLVLPLVGATWALFGLAGPASASASPVPASSSPRVAVVLSASAAPASLSSAGGVVAVTATVENATVCQLQVLSTQSFPVVYSRNPRSCASGEFSAQVTVGPNNSTVQRTVAFALVASNSTSTSEGRFYVLLAGAKPPAVASVSATPDQLPAGGGTVAIAADIANASTCQLQLLSKQSFAVVYSHNSRACTSGTFSAKVAIAANPTTVVRTVAFTLVATYGSSQAADPFYISLAAGAAKSSLPATTSQPSVAASSTAPQVTQSSNWSGYSITGGPFTEVKGTFTVPSIPAGTPPYDQVAEWVGVDGVSGTDTSLIQAGVDEYADPSNPTGFDTEAWWEILPAAETDITSVTVKPGDSVTVTLWKVSTTTWQINLTDNTDGESYTTAPEPYSGPGASAEWIVEATTRCTVRCETSQLAPYSPAVAFSNLGMTGRETALQEDTMVQDGVTVATPSALASEAFSVAYTGQQQSFGRPMAKAEGQG